MSLQIRLRVWSVETKSMISADEAWFTPCFVTLPDGQQHSLPILNVALLAPPTKFVVSQFTGFKDGQGVEIYDGDIVDGSSGATQEEPAEHYRVVVRWISDAGKWMAVCPFTDESWELGDYDSLDRVVGNVWQNPGLLPDCEQEPVAAATEGDELPW